MLGASDRLRLCRQGGGRGLGVDAGVGGPGRGASEDRRLRGCGGMRRRRSASEAAALGTSRRPAGRDGAGRTARRKAAGCAAAVVRLLSGAPAEAARNARGRRTGCGFAGRAAGGGLARIRELADRARGASKGQRPRGRWADAAQAPQRRRSAMPGDVGQAAALQARRRAGAWRGCGSWRIGRAAPRRAKGCEAVGGCGARLRRSGPRAAMAQAGRRGEKPQAARAVGECGAGGHLVAAAALGALRRLARRGCRTGCGFAGKAAGGGLARIRELAGRARGTSKGLRLQGRRANAAQAVCQ